MPKSWQPRHSTLEAVSIYNEWMRSLIRLNQPIVFGLDQSREVGVDQARAFELNQGKAVRLKRSEASRNFFYSDFAQKVYFAYFFLGSVFSYGNVCAREPLVGEEVRAPLDRATKALFSVAESVDSKEILVVTKSKRFEAHLIEGSSRGTKLLSVGPGLGESKISKKILLDSSELESVSLKGWTLDEKIGQLLLIGYRSKKQVHDLKASGLVFFSWSLKTPEQTADLLKDFQNAEIAGQRIPMLLATDHEGGKVLRLRKGMTSFPDAAAIGSLSDPHVAFEVGKAMGLELSSLGFNVNLAPVLDLGNAKSFLANRVWGEDPKRVSLMARAFIQGLHSSRILSVGKHFPGHGGSTEDSHFTLPVIHKSEALLWEQDLIPFKEAIEAGIPAVMTAHVEIPSIDRGPASLSKKFITEILKEKIGFQGLVISDDFEMGGLSKQMGMAPQDLALKALKAGSDMILVVWSEDLQMRVRARVKAALKTGEITQEWLDQKVKKIVAFKKKYLGEKPLRNPYWAENLRRPENLGLVKSIAREAIRWSGGNEVALLGKIEERNAEKWVCLMPNESWASEWKAARKKDEVLVLKRFADPSFIKLVKDKIKEAVKTKTPLLVVTPPRAMGSEDLFLEMKSLFGDLVKQSAIDSPVLWAHQGSTPLKINWSPERLSIGFLSLYSGSKETLKALMDKLGAKKSNANAYRFENQKDLIMAN